MKTNNFVWSISLIVIGIATLILAGASIVGIDLPDVVVRILGIADLVALPILAYSKYLFSLREEIARWIILSL